MTSARHVTGRLPARTPGRGGTAALGLIGAGLYTDWIVLDPTIGGDLSPVRSYVSELSALTHPHHLVANRLDVVSGVCVLLFAVGLLRRLPGAGAAQRLGGFGLAAFGLTTALNGLWPMTCEPSIQRLCAAGGLALHATVQDLAATALSVVAVLGVLGSMLAFGAALRAVPGWQAVAATGRWLFVVAGLLTVVVGVLALLDRDVGLAQRPLVTVQSAWIAVLAVAVLRSRQLVE